MKIIQDLQKQGYFDSHSKVLVAVSAGQDSMSLLHLLHVSHETLGIELGIAHVNHNQRAQSAEEEAYLRQWAEQNCLPIFVAQFEGEFSEQAAREFRYDFFARVMAEQGYTALVTAHHRDDQIETVLMRILRGSRLRHLVGIRPVQDFAGGQLIRPLLSYAKADLPSVFHFEDASNQELTYTRNRVRLALLPQLCQENPKIDQHLLNLAGETDLLLSALSDLTSGLSVTDVPVFLGQTEPVQYFLLQSYLADFSDLEVSKSQFDQLLHILRTKANYQAPFKAGYEVYKDYERFALRKISPRADEDLPSLVLKYNERLTYAGCQLHFSQSATGFPLPSIAPLTIRPIQAGDRIKLGSFHKKIARLLIDQKVPKEERKRAWVVEQEGKVQILRVNHRTYLRKVENHAIMLAKLEIKE